MSPKSSDTRPLSHYVADSLDGFFMALNGHAPKDLYGMILEQVEPPLLKATLKYCGGNQSRAAQSLAHTLGCRLRRVETGPVEERDPAREVAAT